MRRAFAVLVVVAGMVAPPFAAPCRAIELGGRDVPKDTAYRLTVPNGKYRSVKQITERSPGEVRRLALEPFDRYPRLETEDRTERVVDFDLPFYMDVGAGDPMAPLRTGVKASP